MGRFDQALEWIRGAIATRQGAITDYFFVRGTPEQFDQRHGCLVRVETTIGIFFFRAVTSQVPHDPRLGCLLARLFPLHFPECIACDPLERWGLLRDTQAVELSQITGWTKWFEAFEQFARIQIACTAHLGALETIGCPVWNLERLVDTVDAFIAQLREWGIEPDDDSVLAEKLKELCERLGAEAIPISLSHGDFQGNNVMKSGRHCIYIDFAEAYLGMPFFLVHDVLAYMSDKHATEASALLQAYLQPWSEHLCRSVESLMTVVQLSRPLAALRVAMRALECQLYLGIDTDPRRQQMCLSLGREMAAVRKFAAAVV